MKLKGFPVDLSSNNGDIGLGTVSEKVDSLKLQEVEFEDALDIAGLGWYNIRVCCVLAIILAASIIEVLGYSFVLPAAKCDLEISDSIRGFIASIPYLMVVITSFPWGYLVDTRGRRSVMLLCCTVIGTVGVIAGFMPNLVSFAILKAFTSLCLSCPSGVCYPFVGEIVPRRHRDVAMSVTSGFQAIGGSLVPLLAWAILPLEFSLDFGMYNFRPWRLLAMMYSGLFFICTLLLWYCPESPKFLLSQGRNDEALDILRNMYAVNKGKRKEDYPVHRLKLPSDAHVQTKGFFSSLKTQSVPLFKPPYFKWLFLTGFLLFGMFATLNGLNMWIPDVLNRVISGDQGEMTACQVIRQGLNKTSTDEICDDKIDTMTFIINAMSNFLTGTIVLIGSSLLKAIGKKVLLLLAYFVIGAACISINFTTEQYVFAALLALMPACAVALGPVSAYAVEIFPTNLRGMAVSLAMMFGRSASVIGANVAGILISNACEVTFYSFGGLLLLCGFLSMLLPNQKQKKFVEIPIQHNNTNT